MRVHNSSALWSIRYDPLIRHDKSMAPNARAYAKYIYIHITMRSLMMVWCACSSTRTSECCSVIEVSTLMVFGSGLSDWLGLTRGSRVVVALYKITIHCATTRKAVQIAKHVYLWNLALCWCYDAVWFSIVWNGTTPWPFVGPCAEIYRENWCVWKCMLVIGASSAGSSFSASTEMRNTDEFSECHWQHMWSQSTPTSQLSVAGMT